VQGAIMSCLLAFYSIAIGAEFWRGRGDALASRAPLAILCFVNGGIHVAGMLMAGLPDMATADGTADLMQGLLLVQPAFIVVAGGLYGIGIGRDRVEQTLRRAAEIDSLTGVLNRGALFERGAEVLDHARRTGSQLALMLFDLDRFKDINDSLGHLAGDLVLQRFASTAVSALRRDDLIGRIGGEEFCVLVPGANASTAYSVAERIRREFAGARVQGGNILVAATVSVGISGLTEASADLDQLLAQADRALYDAKRSGRDRVVTSVLALAS
jgi:diguanylate cyclase (GGDEF)-like protein